ncbi:MAG: DNA polymerase Y family protein [Chloroflexi bacterium]|nr:DNA polymerase Y family protein [Chloroflexota bacterium]
MKIACLAIPGFALACELAAQPALASEPVALVDASGQRVAALTPSAARRGLQPGMLLREAINYCATLTVLESHPARHDSAAEACVAALASISPIVEEAAPGLVYADLRGLDRLYPSIDALDSAIRLATPSGLRPRLGIAEHKFTAFVAAQDAQLGGTQTVGAPDAAAFLASRPISLLPLDHDTISRMQLLGLTTLGALAALPRHTVVAQFGLPGGWAWEAAHGCDATPVTAPDWREHVLEQIVAEPPLISREAVHYSMQQLLGRILRHRAVAGHFVRALCLRITTEDDQIWSQEQTLKEPSSDRERLWLVIDSILERAQYTGPVVGLSIEILELSRESGKQTVLFPGKIRHRERLDEMVRQLKTRYGVSPMKRLVEVEPWSRIPERRHALMDYDP